MATFEFTANDTMKFNLTRIEVKAGQEVKIILTNTGSMPKAAMAHNWVLLKKDVDGKAYCDAAVTAQATEYLPPALAHQVIAPRPRPSPANIRSSAPSRHITWRACTALWS